MRCYRFELTCGNNFQFGLTNSFKEIGKAVSRNKGSLSLNQNCFGAGDNIAIDFNITYYESDKGEALNNILESNITLYNVNRYWFGQQAQKELQGALVKFFGATKITKTLANQGIKGKDITNTGIKIDSKTINLGTSCYITNDLELLQKPILYGNITNIYTKNENGTTELIITVGTPDINRTSSFSSFLLNNINKKALEIKSGTKWEKTVAQYIRSLYLKRGILPPVIKTVGNFELSQGNYIFENIDSIFNDVYSSNSLQAIIKNTFNSEITINTNGVITIRDLTKETSIKTETIQVISDNDLLTQPTITNYEGNKLEIIITLPLNNKFELGKEFILTSQNSLIFSQNFAGVGDTIQRIGNGKDFGKFIFGKFKVNQIWHSGMSRVSDPNAWTTKIQALLSDDAKQFQDSILSKFKKGFL